MTFEPSEHPTHERILLALILLVYAALAVLYAVQTPAWQVPDEPAHYNYVRQVARDGCCPVIEMGDWDSAYLVQLTSSGFDPQYLDDLPAVQYEDHQPPLYYLLAAPLYRLAGGNVDAVGGATSRSPLLALRLFSAALGAGVIVGIYGVARIASGGNGVIALSAAAFVAFLPQHLAILAGVSNDALAELVVGVGLWLTLRYLNLTPESPLHKWRGDLSGAQTPPPHTMERGPGGEVLLLGLVMGLGFLTKASTWLLAPVIALAIWLRWRRMKRTTHSTPLFSSVFSVPSVVNAFALFALPAVALGALWWLRNLSVYGWPDFTGLGAHDAVVIGQLRTGEMIAAQGFMTWLTEGLRTTFQSFWGQFGWMGVPMPGWVYAALLAFTLVAYAGLIPLALRARREGIDPVRRDILIVLVAVYLLGIAAFLYYNTSFVQFQGRYLYPALAAFALAYAGGLWGWVRWAIDRWANRVGTRHAVFLRWLPLMVMFGLAGLSAYALWRFIIPALPAW